MTPRARTEGDPAQLLDLNEPAPAAPPTPMPPSFGDPGATGAGHRPLRRALDRV